MMLLQTENSERIGMFIDLMHSVLNMLILSFQLDEQVEVWEPTAVFLPEKSHEQRSLVGFIVHGVTKSWTQLSNEKAVYNPNKAK